MYQYPIGMMWYFLCDFFLTKIPLLWRSNHDFVLCGVLEIHVRMASIFASFLWKGFARTVRQLFLIGQCWFCYLILISIAIIEMWLNVLARSATKKSRTWSCLKIFRQTSFSHINIFRFHTMVFDTKPEIELTWNQSYFSLWCLNNCGLNN